MRVPDFESLIQHTEDMYAPDDENLRNIIGIVLYLCNHNSGVISSGEIFDLCISEHVYSRLVRAYATKYGIPPLTQELDRYNRQVWVLNYDTRSMRDVAAKLIGDDVGRYEENRKKEDEPCLL